jgi:hypothetical protein
MSIANKVFRNNKTGESIRVIDSFENIAILENKQKIDVRTLMDQNQYTEQIDPASFFNNQNAYNSLVDKIKSMPMDNIKDDTEDLVSRIGGDLQPTTNESAIIMTNEEDEKAELARKYGATIDNGDAVNRQQAAFDRLLNTDQEETVTRVEVNNTPQTNVSTEYIQPPVQRVEVEDPIITMFKRTKRNVNFNVSVDISDKIPRLDFIEMMEDSYEISMIDFLADEFTEKILRDPSIIRDTIKDKIKQLVYGGEVKSFPPSVNDSITDSVTQKHEPLPIEKEPVLTKDLPKKPRKPRAKKENEE